MTPPGQAVDSRERHFQTVRLEIDKDRSPVSLEPGTWFVCFVPGPFVDKRLKHVLAMRPTSDGGGSWTLFEPWWHRLLSATISAEQARMYLMWGASGDVLLLREAIPGRGSQVRGWISCAALASYLLGRPYWVWTPHGLYRLLRREPNVCRVDVSALLELDPATVGKGSRVVAACDEYAPDAPKHLVGAPKPFCMNCGRDLVPGWREWLRKLKRR